MVYSSPYSENKKLKVILDSLEIIYKSGNFSTLEKECNRYINEGYHNEKIIWYLNQILGGEYIGYDNFDKSTFNFEKIKEVVNSMNDYNNKEDTIGPVLENLEKIYISGDYKKLLDECEKYMKNGYFDEKINWYMDKALGIDKYRESGNVKDLNNFPLEINIKPLYILKMMLYITLGTIIVIIISLKLMEHYNI